MNHYKSRKDVLADVVRIFSALPPSAAGEEHEVKSFIRSKGFDARLFTSVEIRDAAERLRTMRSVKKQARTVAATRRHLRTLAVSQADQRRTEDAWMQKLGWTRAAIREWLDSDCP